MEPDLLLVDMTRMPEVGKRMVAFLADRGALIGVPVVLVSDKNSAASGLKAKVDLLSVTGPTKIISAVKSALSTAKRSA